MKKVLLFTFLFLIKANDLHNFNQLISFTHNNLAVIKDNSLFNYNFKGEFIIGESHQNINLEIDFSKKFSIIECNGIDINGSTEDCEVNQKELTYCPYKSNSVFSSSCDDKILKESEIICSNNVLFLKDKGFFINDILFIDDFFTNHEFPCVKDRKQEDITSNGVISFHSLIKDIVKFEQIYMHKKEKSYLSFSYSHNKITLAYEKIEENEHIEKNG